ncbi:cohesin domain-containing protein [Pseudobacteroides cellulosolvens]|uniref:Cellulosome anchoring protein cohesin region n=1 Tax=Pseudobacteroides cellulosolvens ATCC 35603 = DSM 2933 TaxID=398512 RepID=A0A0L6JTW6_9FIRM|nr:cohesin domain-containing protein [Pseudobacteroides cellulosolvens]KNY28862.1 cellulosome anchoring protein cohesin region [Pseudobacteroides cellulosolvens ATCC 35603 = DSM 2933]
MGNVAVTSNIQIGSQTNPILMWTGDVPVSGVQDNVINTVDQIEISRGFNTSAGSPDYTLDRDLNKDGNIDMIDISILSRHFNATPGSYIPVVSNIMPTGKIKMQVDKTIANVGDIVTATVSIQDISNLIGYQINIKYDPAVLQPVIDGIPYTNSTFPTKGTILSNQTYSPFDLVDNKLINGVLNFSSAYLCMAKYRQNAQPETSGTLAVINFKVLNNTPTHIKFEGYKSMPRAILGTYLYDWNGATYNSGYSVIQPQRIN